MQRIQVVTLVVVSLAFGTVCLAAPPPAISLNQCQNAVKVEGKKFVDGYVNAVATCLQKVSADIVQNNAGTPTAAAANTCVAQFRKISDSRSLGKSLGEKLAAKITAKCAPGGNNTHTLQDILGTGAGAPQSLNAKNIGAYCAQFGGDGTIDTLQEWVDCVTAAHTCAARESIASQYPSGLAWLSAVQPVMSGLTAPPGDLTKITDAVAGLAADQTAIEGNPSDGKPDVSCGITTIVSVVSAVQPLKTGQTSPYGPGSDGDLQKGGPRSYTDNGDGTITDNATGLMWEKKSDDGSIHDKDNTYTWGMTSSPYTMNGTMVTTFLATLNGGGGFAGYTDWRIPNVSELHSIIDYEGFSPSVNAAFNTGCSASCTVTSCSCTLSDRYWSSSTLTGITSYGWFEDFLLGFVFGDPKDFNYHVRAVRDGS